MLFQRYARARFWKEYFSKAAVTLNEIQKEEILCQLNAILV